MDKMEDKLQHLKESLDDSLFQNIHAKDELRRKIKKQARSSHHRKITFLNITKNSFHIVLTFFSFLLIFILLSSFINNQNASSTLDEQQTALIVYQEELIKMMRIQAKAEKTYIEGYKSGTYSEDDLQVLKKEALDQTINLTEQLKQGYPTLPKVLKEHKIDLNKGLNYLATYYLQRADDIDRYIPGIYDLYPNAPPSEDIQKAILNFNKYFGKVYKDLQLYAPNLLIEVFYVLE